MYAYGAAPVTRHTVPHNPASETAQQPAGAAARAWLPATGADLAAAAPASERRIRSPRRWEQASFSLAVVPCNVCHFLGAAGDGSETRPKAQRHTIQLPLERG